MSNETPRYVFRPKDKPPYNYVVWDSEAKVDIAYTCTLHLAKNYAEQMNEKGFIEP